MAEAFKEEETVQCNRLPVSIVVTLALALGASWSFAAMTRGLPSVHAGSSQNLPVMHFAAMNKPDAEIQKCIQDKLAASELKNLGVQVSVKNGQAVLTGDIKNPGHKDTAEKIARGCGAHKYILQQRRAG